MKYRTVVVHARETFTADVTKVIDINIADPISEIIIVFEATNASDTPTAHMAAGIVKIELVDGSDVLFSLDGECAHALDIYHHKGIIRPGNFDYRDNETFRLPVGINFGRYLWDPNLALNPARFENLQLKVQLDEDAGGSAPDAIYLTVLANVFDELVPDIRGFLMAKEIKTWTQADNTHEYTDLPVDYPYRGIYLRSFLAGTDPDGCTEIIKISEDQDKRIPFNTGVNELIALLLGMFPPTVEGQSCAAGTSATPLYCVPSLGVKGNADVLAAAASTNQLALNAAAGGDIDIISHTAAQDAYVQVTGYLPHSTILLPCGIQDDINDWFDPRGLGSLRADIEGAAAAAAFLFLEQLRTY